MLFMYLYFQLFSIPLICSLIIITHCELKGHKTHQHFMTATKQMLSYLVHGLNSGMFLAKGVIVSIYGKRQSDIAIYDSLEGDRQHRNNIQELIEELQLDHTSEQWICLRSI